MKLTRINVSDLLSLKDLAVHIYSVYCNGPSAGFQEREIVELTGIVLGVYASKEKGTPSFV